MVRGEHRYTHDISTNDWIEMSTIWTAWLYRKVLPEVTFDNVYRKRLWSLHSLLSLCFSLSILHLLPNHQSAKHHTHCSQSSCRYLSNWLCTTILEQNNNDKEKVSIEGLSEKATRYPVLARQQNLKKFSALFDTQAPAVLETHIRLKKTFGSYEILK